MGWNVHVLICQLSYGFVFCLSLMENTWDNMILKEVSFKGSGWNYFDPLDVVDPFTKFEPQETWRKDGDSVVFK